MVQKSVLNPPSPPITITGRVRGMDKRDVAKMLTDIIAATPNTQELHPILCAFAKVADELFDQHYIEEADHE